ncbi:uncharacterized protein TrAtP1_010464 [Trichoderma atroviride]|uniref:uncharacterized protein n=1 Tax=Hypocrea atroviridis TaxID=63577 RepID=UPI003320E07A|nr:hypothetical protein TrAtP1_010464 [Trichoderma atroviride]
MPSSYLKSDLVVATIRQDGRRTAQLPAWDAGRELVKNLVSPPRKNPSHTHPTVHNRL